MNIDKGRKSSNRILCTFTTQNSRSETEKDELLIPFLDGFDLRKIVISRRGFFMDLQFPVLVGILCVGSARVRGCLAPFLILVLFLLSL